MYYYIRKGKVAIFNKIARYTKWVRLCGVDFEDRIMGQRKGCRWEMAILGDLRYLILRVVPIPTLNMIGHRD